MFRKHYVGLLKSLNDPELDYMEYPTNALAQAAYVSSEAGIIKDSYSETNQSDTNVLKSVHPSSSGFSASGQAFTAAATFNLISVKFYMAKVGSPTGTGYARLYAATGTVGTNAKPTGNALASSTGFDVSALGTSLALVTFDFSASLYELQNGTDYCIVFENPASGTINASNYPFLGNDGSTPTHAGNMTFWLDGVWGAASGWDDCFYVYGRVLQSYSEATIKTQGSYALKGVAAITDSINKTLTRTVSPPINCSGMNSWKTDARALRLGSNFKITLHNSNAAIIESTPAIAEASVFQTEDVDLSAIADADKNAIDEIKITILDALAANTIYLDNMFAELVVTATARRAQKGLISGFHCFVKQYIDFTKLSLAPLKLPDGTLW